jgi:hypothetical protein
MTAMLTAETFQAHVNKVFRVKENGHALTLSQVELRQMDARELAELGRQSFTLIFAGPPGNVLRDGLYTLEVEGGPSFQLYVIPIRTLARDRQDYQAVFN